MLHRDTQAVCGYRNKKLYGATAEGSSLVATRVVAEHVCIVAAAGLHAWGVVTGALYRNSIQLVTCEKELPGRFQIRYQFMIRQWQRRSCTINTNGFKFH